MWSPFDDFPREIGTPARIGLVKNMGELIQKLNIYNQKTTFFTSLYAFDETQNNRGIYSTARIRQIYFDIDSPQNLDPVKIMHNYCTQHNLIHCIMFSGGGFHFYIATKYSELKNKKGAVTNSQIHIADKLNLKIGINNGSDIDGHIIGNLAQMVRPPTSFNMKRKLFCTSLKSRELTSIPEIQKIAQNPRPGIFVYGKEYLDLEPFDSEPVTKPYDMKVELETSTAKIGLDKINMKSFPPCIRWLLDEKFISNKARYIVILYCRELGLPLSDTISILRENLDLKKFVHCVFQERQPFFTYRRTDLEFPSCATLKSWGVCPSETCKGANLY